MIRATALCVVALLLQTACDKPGEAAPASGTSGGTAAQKGGAGGPGGNASRVPTAVVLGPSDVAPVTLGTIESGVQISGDLRPIEQVMIRSRVEGDVTDVLVREGDPVRKGQLLARFADAVQEGDRASAVADLESAKSDLVNAQWNVDQSDELLKAGAIPERDLRTAQQTLSASRARVAAAEARVRATTQTSTDTRILATNNGIVETRSVEPGEHVARGATLFTVVRNDVLELAASVPSRQEAEVKPGQVVRFVAAGRTLEGKVARIAPTINTASRSVTVYLQVPNAGGELKGNTFATGRIIGRSVSGAIVIPASAVRQSQQSPTPFVYRIVDDKVEHAPVELGIVDETRNAVQVVDGLAVGDRIIVGNLGVLGRGMPVRIISGERTGATAEAGGTDGARGAAADPVAKRPDRPKSP
jgi:membrane fusion protein, multidrug efflux system